MNVYYYAASFFLFTLLRVEPAASDHRLFLLTGAGRLHGQIMSVNNNSEMTTTVEINEEGCVNLTEHQDECFSTKYIKEMNYHAELSRKSIMEEEHIRPIKREREDDQGGEWMLVQRKETKNKINKLEVYISSNEKLPKQFTLAKLFLQEGILDIDELRYISPYKVRVDTTNEASAEKIENCCEFTRRGWRIQKAMEVNSSYGVIRNVDIDLTEEEIFKSIKCPEPGQLLSVHCCQASSSMHRGYGLGTK